MIASGVRVPSPTCADCLTQDLCRDGGACAIKVGREEELAPNVQALRTVLKVARILAHRPRPMCRDCADEDGTCPGTGLPCDLPATFQAAEQALAALGVPEVHPLRAHYIGSVLTSGPDEHILHVRYRTREAADAAQAWLADEAGVTPAEAPSKRQPCGCVLCTCEDEEQCHGCGAKFCESHKAARGVPEPVGINGLTEAETSATASVAGIVAPSGVPGTDGGKPE